MKINTHCRIDHALCGKPLFVGDGTSRVEMVTTPPMAADEKGLVHGGFIFGAADYAAMIAVNHPHVVLGASDVKFLKPVRVGETVLAKARVQEIKGKKILGVGQCLHGRGGGISGHVYLFCIGSACIGINKD